MHKKEKIRITWHIFLAFLADISFSRLILAEKLTSVNSRSVTQIVSKQAFKKQPQQLSSSDWSTNLWYVLKAFYILVKMWKQKKMELYNCSFDKWFFYLKYNYSNEIIPNYFISGNEYGSSRPIFISSFFTLSSFCSSLIVISPVL